MLYELERETRALFHAALGLEEVFCGDSVKSIGTKFLYF